MIYELKSDLENFAHFYEDYDKLENSFIYRHLGWQKIDMQKYVKDKFLLLPSDTGKKNYQFDISVSALGIIIISEKAFNSFSDIWLNAGQVFDIDTPSKRKKFYGFYPNNKIYPASILNLVKSEYRKIEDRVSYSKIVFNSPIDEYIFTLENYNMSAFITDKFRQAVEDAGLIGFDFSKKYEVIR